MYDEVLFTVDRAKALRVERVGLDELDLQERAHLQEWVIAHPDVIGPGTQIVTTEYDRWQTATGTPVLDRLDILAIDADGRLVVVELKRGAAPHTIQMQAINYAAMVSRLTVTDVADLFAAHRQRQGEAMDRDSALTELETQLLLSDSGIRSPRIVLIASDFPPAVTASVVWLNEQQVDISLIRFRAYRVENKVVVSFSRLYPVPEVEEFTIGRRREAAASQVEQLPGDPWDETALRRLAGKANRGTMALLDLCAVDAAQAVSVKDIAGTAGITEASVRGQLAGFTMTLRNPKNGFTQTVWPTTVKWLAGGVASYTMDPSLAASWRAIRDDETPSPAASSLLAQ